MFRMILETVIYYTARPKQGRWWQVQTRPNGTRRMLPTAARREMYARIQRTRFKSGRHMTVFRFVFMAIMRLRSWRRIVLGGA